MEQKDSKLVNSGASIQGIRIPIGIESKTIEIGNLCKRKNPPEGLLNKNTVCMMLSIIVDVM